MVEIFLAVYKTNDVRNPVNLTTKLLLSCYKIVTRLLQLIDIQNAISFMVSMVSNGCGHYIYTANNNSTVTVSPPT